jgi:hypothetical protein
MASWSPKPQWVDYLFLGLFKICLRMAVGFGDNDFLIFFNFIHYVYRFLRDDTLGDNDIRFLLGILRI